MTRSLITLTTFAAASPAFAHVDGHFHSHGMEYLLVPALIAAGIATYLLNR